MSKLISIIIPVHNEEKNVPLLFVELQKVFRQLPNYDFEMIFVNDGSTDSTLNKLDKIRQTDAKIQIIDFSRNFGKELATTAGIKASRGEACIMVDADLQHPIEKIPEFVAKWESGAEVVVGVRKNNKSDSLTKRVGSFLFYKIINSISDTKIISGATDFRLLDRGVIDEFNQFTERSRMTRALIDWMGFRREYVFFEARERLFGQPSYSFWKLTKLAFNSMISLSLFPLRIAGYLGIIITILAGLLGAYMLTTNYIVGTINYSAPAILAVINVFLIGIVLICLGLIALYIANIHNEVIGRPMYIIRKSKND